MMNSCNFIGRMLDEPRSFEEASGIRAVFTLAVDRDKENYRDDGTSNADYLDFVAWGEVANDIMRDYHKGDLVAVSDARAKVHSYVDGAGQRKRKTEYRVSSIYHLPRG